jgi:hypothetical protein
MTTRFWRRFSTPELKTHVLQYLGSPLEDQAIEPTLAAPGNLSPVDQRTECLHKSFHQTSTQEYLVSSCLAFGYTPSPVTPRSIRTLQKSVHNMDDTDKEFVSNRCGHCGAFVLAHIHKPLPSQNNALVRLRALLQNINTCPLKGSSWSLSRTNPYKPSKPLRMSVAPTAR